MVVVRRGGLSFTNVESYIFHAIPAFTRYSLFRQCIDIIDDDHDKMLQQLQDKQEPIVEVNELLESHDTRIHMLVQFICCS